MNEENAVAYIESTEGLPIDDWGLFAWLGFRDRSTRVVLYDTLDPMEVPLSKRNILVATTDQSIAYLDRLGIFYPGFNCIPLCLERLCHRRIERTTMGEFLANPKLGIFIKPESQAKAFVCGVIRMRDSLDFLRKEADPGMRVIVSEVVDFLVEYRCYVYGGRLRGSHFYAGDFRRNIDLSVVDEAIEVFEAHGAPAGYCLDFGLLPDGRTAFIEANDGFALGNYGLSPDKYVSLLTRRWRELTAPAVL